MKLSAGQILATLAALCTLDACSHDNASGAARQDTNQRTVVYHMEYPSYRSLDELFERADLVIRARVSPSVRAGELRPTRPVNGLVENLPSNAAENSARNDRLVTTVFQAEVAEVFKGSATAGQVVEIKQLGGDSGDVHYMEEGSTALNPGRTYLLFLAVFPGAPASLLNPTQGQYVIDAAGNPTPVGGNSIQISTADLRKRSATD